MRLSVAAAVAAAGFPGQPGAVPAGQEVQLLFVMSPGIRDELLFCRKPEVTAAIYGRIIVIIKDCDRWDIRGLAEI